MKIYWNMTAIAVVMILGTVHQSYAHEHGKNINLFATLSPPNQNGTNPEFRTDTFGTVPSESTGTFSATLNIGEQTLNNIELNVVGMKVADLKNFGPNSTPFHIHLPNSGEQGDFGFNVIDLLFGSSEANLIDTEAGFKFTRESLSITEASQGKYKDAGVHPGDDIIASKLQEGFPFVLVHSAKNIFTNTIGKLPNGKPVPEGFPFGELRGEITITK